MTNAFGPEWSTALVLGCADIVVPYEWVLATLALESGFDPMARSSAGARGLWQRMPVHGQPYAETDPVRQLQDGFAFWRAQIRSFHVGEIRSREAFYCLNFAPARLAHGAYDDETVVYGAPSAAYRANAAAFGRDPRDPFGLIRMRDLAVGLDAGVRRCRARYDAEIASAAVANLQGRPSQPFE